MNNGPVEDKQDPQNGIQEALEEKIEFPAELSVLPMHQVVVYPHIIVPLVITRDDLVRLIDDALQAERIVAAISIRGEDEESYDPENLYGTGTAAAIVRMLKIPDGSTQLLLQGLERISVEEYIQTEPYLRAKVKRVSESKLTGIEVEALSRNLLAQFRKMVDLAPHLPDEMLITAMNISEPNNLADFVAANTNLSVEEKQELLEMTDVKKRLQKITFYISREIEILEIGSRIQSRVQTEMSKSQKEYFLREQMKAIQEELGEVDEKTLEITEFREKIEESGMSQEAKKEAERELNRLAKMPVAAAEYTVSRTYLEWITSLPWNSGTEDCLDVDHVRSVLDEDHYDLDKVKQRIIEYLAVGILKKDMKGPILSFVGPPGVGKTSLGQSIARALGRKFVRLSLGGIHDEAEIRGHRRTYIGALPGRIIQGIRKAESNNPVFMLDEIDKVGADFRGDPAAALLEVLDPEQNSNFSDHYLDVPFDLSKVMFITTANTTYPIQPALLDRMEVLEIPGYTEIEKLHIAKTYLVTRQIEDNGLKKGQMSFSDEALKSIIRNYTREAGVRNLERQIAAICRKTATDIVSGKRKSKKMNVRDLHNYLGPAKFRFEAIEEENEVGVATGLAWTETGGDVLFVEASIVKGDGKLTLTGKLGDVMQESAKAALTYCRSMSDEYNVSSEMFSGNDFHIHVPSGAIPKDGPSAGVTMAAALMSALTDAPLRKDVAMTGEITLHGKVLPIGGLKEKLLAAMRAGVRMVIIPEENEKDITEIPKFVTENIQLKTVKRIDEILTEVMIEKENEQL